MTRPLVTRYLALDTTNAFHGNRKLKSFFSEIREDHARGTYNPSSLFSLITRKVPMFRGFQQQDAHDFLINLMDILVTEYDTFYKQANKMKSVAGDPMRQPNRPKAIIEDVFMAGLCSNVKCLSCNRMSRTFDPSFGILLEISFNKRELVAGMGRAKSFYKHVPKSSSLVTTVSETTGKERPGSKAKNASSPKSLFTCFRVPERADLNWVVRTQDREDGGVRN